MTNKKTDSELLFRLSKSDPESDQLFTELYSRYYHRVCGFLLAKGLNAEDVQDLAQQVFIRLFDKRERYRQGSSAEAWIFIVARSVFLDGWRSQVRSLKNKQKLQEQMSQNSSEESYPLLKDLDLSVEDLELLQKRFEKGLSFEELAREMKASSAALRKRVSRLYEKIKKRKQQV